ncbi:ribosomal protein S18-alanine N-acetyltransferase [Amycolatopsis sp. cmx-4-54]|uniref:ribosomal protein S18-alanine N-acetyltransferase n=1 Tax=Amycolatopsis sp. cmx-4-54 TaxID=2790936 RepID=UPI00397DD3CC
MRLEPLRRNDIPRCVEIEKILFPGDSPWTAYAFHAELDGGGYYLVVRPDESDEVIGYAGLAVVGRRGDYEASIHTIGVDPVHQRKGIGTMLLKALLDRADELAAPVFLEVRTDNDAAITLYERHGFEHIGLRKRYYQPSGADAYTMARPRAQVRDEVAG